MNLERALITDATTGIGRQLAFEFARHGHPLVLAAPVHAKLEQISTELLESFNVELRVLVANLDLAESPHVIFDTLASDGMAVDILVNSSEPGRAGRFWEIPLEKHISLLRVNVEAMVRVTRLFLPGMVQRQQGRILNIAPLLPMEAAPGFALYHGASALVRSLSEILALDLKGSGVTVSVLSPSPEELKILREVNTPEQMHHVPRSMESLAAAGYKGLMAGDGSILA